MPNVVRIQDRSIRHPSKAVRVEAGAEEAHRPTQREPPERGAQEDPDHEAPRGDRVRARRPDADRGEDRDKREDRHRVGEGQHERRGVGAEEPRAAQSGRSLGGLGADRADAQIEQERSADEADRGFSADQEVGEHGEPEGRQAAVDRVGRGRAQAGHEAGRAPVRKRAPDAEHPDRAHGGRDREADHDPAHQEAPVHVRLSPRIGFGILIGSHRNPKSKETFP